jgi:hypothetical protein
MIVGSDRKGQREFVARSQAGTAEALDGRSKPAVVTLVE